MTSVAVSPDEYAFRSHIAGGRFQAGVDRGQWRLMSLAWPHGLIAVSAAPRAGSPHEFFFRFEVAGYPDAGATACIWDVERNCPLDAAGRPKGTWTPSPFRPDWLNGEVLYLAIDRVACQQHQNWRTDYPGDLWDPRRGITKYLLAIYELLNEDAYTGV